MSILELTRLFKYWDYFSIPIFSWYETHGYLRGLHKTAEFKVTCWHMGMIGTNAKLKYAEGTYEINHCRAEHM